MSDYFANLNYAGKHYMITYSQYLSGYPAFVKVKLVRSWFLRDAIIFERKFANASEGYTLYNSLVESFPNHTMFNEATTTSNS